MLVKADARPGCNIVRIPDRLVRMPPANLAGRRTADRQTGTTIFNRT